jgi:lipopolysaccharide biosynthesis glycosyltransferase
MNDALRVVMSGDLVALPVLATCIGSLVRHTVRERVEVDVYTRAAALPDDVVGDRLRVHFRRPPRAVECNLGRLPSEMFDRLWVMEDRPEWVRCLVWDWDMVAVGGIDGMYDVEMAGRYGAYVVSPKGATYLQNKWVQRGAWARELPGVEQVYFRFGGVMNLDECRRGGIMARMLEWAHGGSTEQALLASAMGGNYAPLETKWNALPAIEAMPDDVRVLHFFGTKKPWIYPKVSGGELWAREATTWGELRGR